MIPLNRPIVNETLADFDDVAFRIGHPNRLPAWDDGVELQRPQRYARFIADAGDTRIDIVNLKSDVSHTRLNGTIFLGLKPRSLCTGAEDFDVRVAQLYEDDLIASSDVDRPCAAEAEVLRVEPLLRGRITAIQCDMVKTQGRRHVTPSGSRAVISSMIRLAKTWQCAPDLAVTRSLSTTTSSSV